MGALVGKGKSALGAEPLHVAGSNEALVQDDLIMQGDKKLPSLKTLQAEQQRLLEEQQRLYDERAKLKKEARMIDTMKANVDIFLKPSVVQEPELIRDNQRE